jgi:hypothetical protein
MTHYNNYLLTGIGIELPLKGIEISNNIEFPEIFTNNDISFYLVPVVNSFSSDIEVRLFTRGMICLKSNRQNIDSTKAKYLFHMLETSFLLYYFCIAKDHSDEWTILALPASILTTKLPWTIEVIKDYCKEEICPPYYPSINEFEHCFVSYSVETLESIKDILEIVNMQMHNKTLQNASSYFYSSVKKLGLDICDWRDSDYDPQFDPYINIGLRESCFQDAYKSIEAILGDAGGLKNRDIRLSLKLKSLNIDPEEEMGYRIKEKILTKILRFVVIRDKFSAHGSTPKGLIQLTDIIDAQSCARYLITLPLVNKQSGVIYP